jgi:hypothetical protein
LLNVDECIEISKEDWNSRESSWGFRQNELIRSRGENLEECYNSYRKYWSEKFWALHSTEVNLNKGFIESFGLEGEMSSDVELEDITILSNELSIRAGSLIYNEKEILSQLVSYAVGCMFGRFSLDKDGLVLASNEKTLEGYLTSINKNLNEASFLPDDDNIIPVLADEWFNDDITGRFYEFLTVIFKKDVLSENLSFVENCIGKDIRSYFLKDFHSDHITRYKKRPIYWMFSSEKGAFNVLIYMHRYTPDTLNIILNDYLRPFIDKLKNRVSQLEHIEQTGEGKEKTKAIKEMDKLKLQIKECEEYEREVLYPLASKRIEIDLDDGVLVNYNKFGKAVKEVPGLNDKKTKEKVRKFDWIDTSEII